MLGEFALRGGERTALRIEDDAAGRGRALVDGEDIRIGWHWASLHAALRSVDFGQIFFFW
ncbi:hypothetical protein ACFSLT_24015 [Novosphingobium resinovorum]